MAEQQRPCLVFTSRTPTAESLPISQACVFEASRDVWGLLYDGHSEQAQELYIEEMRRSYRVHRMHWDELLRRPSVTLQCPCTDVRTCHRRWLSKILAKVGAVSMGEIKVRQPVQILHQPANDLFVAIDVERSDEKHDSVCEVGIAVVQHGKITLAESHLVRPPRSKVTTSRIHGLRWEDLKDQPTFDTVWYRILPWLYQADFMVAHNATTERHALGACCELYDLFRVPTPLHCSLELARVVWHRQRGLGLKDLCSHLGIRLDNHHRAKDDAIACAKIVLRARQDSLRAAS